MKYFISILLLFASLLSIGQISGDATVTVNQNNLYEFDNGLLIFGGVNWTATGGTVVSTSVSGSSNKATIKFTTNGSQTITARRSNNNALLGIMNVTVQLVCPSMPSTPSVSPNTCGSKTLTRSNPPSNITWYWQTSSGGTSTSNSSTTYTKSSSGTVYLRARNADGCWSSTRSVAVTVNTAPSTPTITLFNESCGSSTAKQSTPASGTTNYWQTSSSGTSTSNSSLTYQRTTSGTVYLRARNNSSGCWSSARSFSLQVDAVPSTPPSPSVSTNTCGNKTLTRNNPPSGFTYYWQTSSGGISTGNSSSTYSRSSSGTVYLRSRNNSTQCWSTARSISVSVNPTPSTPPTPSVSTNTCGPKTLTRASHPSGHTYYWQTSSGGTSTSNSSSTYSKTSSGTVYLRSRNNTSGCWGSARSVSAIVNPTPSQPSAPSISPNTCGNKTVTRGTPPSGVTWYWQTSSGGTSTSNSSSTYTRTSTGTVYLRAKQGSCWSAVRSVSVTVNHAPSQPTISLFNESCGSSTAQRSNPASGTTNYWQTSSSGTSTSNSSSTYTRTTSGTVYLRARNNSSGCWSSVRSFSLQVDAVPSTPPTPTASTNNCGSKTLIRSNPPSGFTYYWQTTSTGTSIGSSGNYTASSSGTYYLRSRNNSTECWSSARSISVTVNPTPSTPPTPSVSTNTCGPKTLTRASHPSGHTYYWQASSGGVSTANSSSTYTANNSGTYFLRSRNNSSGCWGNARSVSAIVNPIPSQPSAPSISSNTCGDKTLTRGTPPSGVTWYWQTGSGGTSTGNSSSTYTADGSLSTVYLRAKQGSCWSTVRSVSVTVNHAPSQPTISLFNESCGSSTAQRSNPASGTTNYWQTSASGTSTSNSSLTYQRTSTGNVYLRARNNTSGCWSSVRSFSLQVDAIPSMPPSPTVSNETCGSKTLTRSNPPSGFTYYWQTSSGGTSTTGISSSSTYSLGETGTLYLRSRNNTTECWSSARSISVTVNPIPSTPPVPAVSTDICGPKTITRATPPSGFTYYWQTSTGGTEETNSSSTLSATSSGDFYLRAKNNTTGCWSGASSVSAIVNPIPSQPSAPSISSNTCGDKTLTRGTPPSGATWYWQTSSGGTSTGNSSSTYTADGSLSTVYLRAKQGSCWSTVRSVSVTVNHAPSQPTISLFNESCGTSTAQRSSPASGTTNYWQTSTAGTSTTNSSLTYQRTSTGNVYLRARNNTSGCWSSVRSFSLQVDAIPSMPSSPTVSTETCGSKTLTRSNPPSGFTYYWQTDADGQSTVNASSTFPADISGDYYLRSQNNTTLCWSPMRSVNVAVNAIPSTPPTPSVSTNTCGLKTLTRASHPSGHTYYWQTDVNGQSTSNSSSTYPANISDTYYLRSQNNTTLCWSPASSVSAIVNPLPSQPSTPSISSNTCGDKILTRGTPPSGTTWYWQTSSGGTSTSNSSSTYTADGSLGTIFMRAKNSNCWSEEIAVNVTVNPVPYTPDMPSVSPNCGSTTLTKSASPSNETWYWQTSATGTDETDSNTDFIANVSGDYYLRSKSNAGCWGPAQLIATTVDGMPTIGQINGQTDFCGINSTTDLSYSETTSTQSTWEELVNGVWQPVMDNGSFVLASNNLQLNAQNGAQFRVAIPSATCATQYTSPVTIVVEQLDGGYVTAPMSQFTNNAVMTLSLSSYQGNIQEWNYRLDGGGWLPVPNSAGQSNISIDISETTDYKAIVQTSLCGTEESAVKTISIVKAGIAGVISSTADMHSSADSDVSVSLSGHNGDVEWYWIAADSADWIHEPSFDNATSFTINVASIGSQDVHIRAKISNDGSEEFTQVFTSFWIDDPIEDLASNNYVKVITPLVPATQIDLSTLSLVDNSISLSYSDGLGRSVQSVSKASTPGGEDVISFTEFDELGRSTRAYLPFTDTGNDFYTDLVSQQLNYYSQDTPEGIEASSTPFADMVYDERGQVIKQGAAGDSWQIGSGHEVEFDYEFNDAADEVVEWQADGTSTNNYAANLLIKNTVIDENDNEVIAFTDVRGNQVLKKVQEGANTWLSTYHIYDINGRLLYTLPPKAVEILGAGAVHDANDVSIADLIYTYEYDEEGKLIAQKIPGKTEKSLIVYDPLDRPVLVQDAQLKATNQWTFTKYDRKGRPIYTGLYQTTDSRADLQTYYDGLNYEAGDAYYETDSSNVAFRGYTNHVFPTENVDIQSYNYYDDYNYQAHWGMGETSFDNPDERSATQMDGTSQYIALDQFYDQANSIENLTIEAWINTDYVGSGWYNNWAIIDFDRSEHFNLFVHGVNGKLGFSTKGGNIHDFYSNTAVNDGEWHHVAATFDGVNKRVYIDGVLDNEVVNPHNGNKLGTSKVRYGFIGDGSEATSFNGSRNNKYFQGQIGEVRLWHDVRSEEQLNQYQDVPLTGNEAGLVGKWSMSGIANGVEDETGNGNDGTVVNNATQQTALKEGGLALVKNNYVRGLPTGSLVKAGTEWLYAVNYYDEDKRVIQTVSSNHLGGRDESTIYYEDFTNRVLKTVQTHDNTENLVQITQSFDYDHRGRVINTWHQLNNGPVNNISSQDYNELGQVIEKNLHGQGASQFLQSVDYTYNIRGWLTGINDPSLNDGENDIFGMKLVYDDAASGLNNTQQYNGNISAITWSNFDNEESNVSELGYAYTYDKTDRLKGADYHQKNLTWNASNAYKLSGLTYDANGNIESLDRTNSEGSSLDQLSYNYFANQLTSLTDGSTNLEGFADGNTGTDDYAYDASGNMTKDLNKNIDTIQYNHLNKPIKIILGDSILEGGVMPDSLTYLYSAAGAKLKMTAWKDGNPLTWVDYVGGMRYEQDTLHSIAHSEGRIICHSEPVEGYTYDYQYTLSDHQGNTRRVLSTKAEVFETVEDFEDTTSQFTDLHPLTYATANSSVGGSKVELLQSGQTGAMVLLKMDKGDTVSLRVQANYETAPSNNNYLNMAYSSLFSSFNTVYGSGSEGVSISGSATQFDSDIASSLTGAKDNTSSAPRAYLNYILFDLDMNVKTAGFQQVSTNANGIGVHEQLEINDILAQNAGYLLAYLSNENQEAVNMHFDDFEVRHAKTNVVQAIDYFPFGMEAKTYTRTASDPTQYLYNSGVEQNDYTSYYETFYRQYDASIGRFAGIDPLASSFASQTPYQYGNNDPIFWNDPLGDCACTNSDQLWNDNDYRYAGNSGYEDRVSIGSGNHWTDKLHLEFGHFEFLAYRMPLSDQPTVNVNDNNTEVSAYEILAETSPNQNPLWREKAKKAIKESNVDQTNGRVDGLDQNLLHPELRDNLGDASTAASVSSGVLGFGQLRFSRTPPLGPVVGTYGKLGAVRTIAGKAGTAAALVTVAIDAQAVSNGDLTMERFGFRTTGTLSAIGVGALVGTEFGGPVGTVAGAAVGGVFQAAEYAYDKVNKFIDSYILIHIPANPTFPIR